MNAKEKPIFLSKNKKIQLIKNISVNLKCIKAQKIKLDNKMNQNLSKKNVKNEEFSKNKKIYKNINIIDIKKIPAANRMNQKRCKSTKSLSVNNSNKSYIKHAFIIKRNEKSLKNNKSYVKTTVNTIKHKKNDYFKKINLKKKSNNAILSNNNINNLSPINRPKKIIQNNAEITQNNPMELTFGSSSFMSNNLQTETNETDKDKEKVSIKVNNKIKKKNNSFFVLNSKKNFRDKNSINANANNNNIGPNKIVKLNKKLILKQSWKIKPSHIKFRPARSLNNKDKEKYKEDKNNKSAFIIHNYNTKTKFKGKHK